MFCFPLTLTHGSSVCIRVHFNYHISVSLTLCALFITPLLLLLPPHYCSDDVMSVGRASSVHNFFSLSFCTACHLQWNFFFLMAFYSNV